MQMRGCGGRDFCHYQHLARDEKAAGGAAAEPHKFGSSRAPKQLCSRGHLEVTGPNKPWRVVSSVQPLVADESLEAKPSLAAPSCLFATFFFVFLAPPTLETNFYLLTTRILFCYFANSKTLSAVLEQKVPKGEPLPGPFHLRP